MVFEIKASCEASEKSMPGHESAHREGVGQSRPAWWREDGLVMAGVDWEPLLPRLRAGSWDRSQAFLDYDQKIAIWNQEHSEEVAQRLKEMGFNFLMVPFYKGGSLNDERSSMEAAVRFTRICHKLNLRVGGYVFSGTILFESMFAQDPDAKNWLSLDPDGNYIPYGSLYYRRFANRSYPGLKALLREVVRIAVDEARVDLLHFDNYVMSPGYEPYSVQEFISYLRTKYSPEERTHRFGFAAVDYFQPPPAPPRPNEYNGDPLYRDFIDYRCKVMADTYRQLAEYARSLNPDIVMEFNPGGYTGELIPSLGIGGVDHTRMLQWGGAFWDEGYPSRMEKGVMVSRFRSQMIARYFNNMVFCYTSDPVAMAESMANNLQCLGCPAWVTGDQMTPELSLQNSKEFNPLTLAMIRLFHHEQQFYRNTKVVADVGVLNTYANTAYGPDVSRQRWQAFTQALYQGKFPFLLVPDSFPGDLNRFRVLVLADLALISDELVNSVRSYVQAGGGLVMTGQSTLFNEQGHRRGRPGLADLFDGHLTDKFAGRTHHPLRSEVLADLSEEHLTDNVIHARSGKGRAVYLPKIAIPENFRMGMLPDNYTELLEAVRWAAGGLLQIEVRAPETVTMCLYEQPNGRKLLHLVNYDDKNPVSNVEVKMQRPSRKAITSVRFFSPDSENARIVTVKHEGQTLLVTVPRLEVYGLLVFE